MPVDLRAPVDRETRLRTVRADRLAYRWAYSRAAETIQSGEVGQDVVWARHDDHALVFAVCDGVSQSFFGDLAAQILGFNLTRWLWDDRLAALPETALRRKLNALLAELAPLATQEVQQIAIPADLPAMVRAVLDQKRAIGSAAMFACGRIDPPSTSNPAGRLILAWVGDIRLRLWVDRRSAQGTLRQPVNLGGQFATQEQWSSLGGLVGTDSVHLFMCAASDAQGSLAQLRVFSDGLKRLDQAGPALAPAEIDAALDAARLAADSDDSSWFEVFFDPDEVQAVVSAQAGSVPTQDGRPLPLIDQAAPTPDGSPPPTPDSVSPDHGSGLTGVWRHAVARYGRLPVGVMLGAMGMVAVLGLALLPLLISGGASTPKGDGEGRTAATAVLARTALGSPSANASPTTAVASPTAGAGSEAGGDGSARDPAAIPPTSSPIREFTVRGAVKLQEASGGPRPMVNLQVVLIDEADRPQAVARTDADGRFELSGLAVATAVNRYRFAISGNDTRTWGLRKQPPVALDWSDDRRIDSADGAPSTSAIVGDVMVETDPSPSGTAVIHADIWFDADGDGSHDPEEASAPGRRLALIEVEPDGQAPIRSKTSEEASDPGGHVALVQPIAGAASVKLALDSDEPCWVDGQASSTDILGGRVYYALCPVSVAEEGADPATGVQDGRVDVRGRLVVEEGGEATGSAFPLRGHRLRLLGGNPPYIVASAEAGDDGAFAFLAVPDGEYCVDPAVAANSGAGEAPPATTSGCKPPAQQVRVGAGRFDPADLVLMAP